MTLNKILSYFQKIKEKYLAKTSREKWELIRNINVYFLDFMGAGFMESNYKIDFKTYIPGIAAVHFVCLLLYTLYFYRHDPFRALQSTCVIGIIVPVRVFIEKVKFH